MSTLSLQNSRGHSSGWRTDAGVRETSGPDLCALMKSLLESHGEDSERRRLDVTSDGPDLMSALQTHCESSGLVDRCGGEVHPLVTQLSKAADLHDDRIMERRQEGRYGVMRVEATPTTGLRVASSRKESIVSVASSPSPY